MDQHNRLPSVGIIGYGFVGKATANFKLITSVVIYDKYIEQFSNNYKDVIEQDIVFVCVPTNINKNNKLDLSAIDEAISLWSKRKNKNSILVIKSTVTVGTTDILSKKYKTNRIIFNPEFLTQRTANLDFLHADEIILGTYNFRMAKKLANLYCELLGTDIKIKYTIPKIAELIKLVRNSFYGVKVEFMNEIYDICDELDINYNDFRKNFVWEGRSSWISEQHTFVPGPDGKRGFGGKCLPKDSRDLLSLFKEYNINAPVLAGSISGNKHRR